jgi:hypothetical protein
MRKRNRKVFCMAFIGVFDDFRPDARTGRWTRITGPRFSGSGVGHKFWRRVHRAGDRPIGRHQMPLDERCQFRKMFRHFVMATPTHVFPTILPNIRSDGKRVVPVSALVVIANRRRDGIAVAVFRVGFRTVGFFCDFVSVLFMIDIVCSMFDSVKGYLD